MLASAAPVPALALSRLSLRAFQLLQSHAGNPRWGVSVGSGIMSGMKVAVGLGILVFVLAGCGSGSPPAAPTSTTVTAPTSTPAATTASATSTAAQATTSQLPPTTMTTTMAPASTTTTPMPAPPTTATRVPDPVPPPAVDPPSGGLNFRSCAEAKKAGFSHMRRGTPGYSAKLDGDGDGIACDKVG